MGDRPDWALPELLATMPSVCAKLLDAHTADAGGRCRGCRSQVGRGERWPCTLYWAALRARDLV